MAAGTEIKKKALIVAKSCGGGIEENPEQWLRSQSQQFIRPREKKDQQGNIQQKNQQAGPSDYLARARTNLSSDSAAESQQGNQVEANKYRQKH